MLLALALCQSIHSFVCSSACPPTHPLSYCPLWSLCLCSSAHFLLHSLLSCVASSLSSFLPHSFCIVIISVLSCHQFVLALISFTSLVAAVNKFVSLFKFQIAGALLIFFCIMSTLPAFSRARGCAQVRIWLAGMVGWTKCHVLPNLSSHARVRVCVYFWL